jgi:hypothetical protein
MNRRKTYRHYAIYYRDPVTRKFISIPNVKMLIQNGIPISISDETKSVIQKIDLER